MTASQGVHQGPPLVLAHPRSFPSATLRDPLLVAFLILSIGCGGRVSDTGKSSGATTDPARCVLNSTNYDQSCTVDSDCVTGIFLGNACTECICPNSAINKEAAGGHASDSAMAFSSRPPTAPMCNCGGLGPSCCQNGECVVNCAVISVDSGASASGASAFVGTWLCGSVGATPGPMTITASGNQITETTSQTIIPDPTAGDASETITCTGVLTVSGTTATFDPGTTVCTGAPDIEVSEPSSDTQTLNGNTITIVVSYPDSSPSTAVCKRE